MSAGTFAKKVAIVTGGAKGIGAATVRALATEDAGVVIGDVDDLAGSELAQHLRAGGHRVIFVQTDVAAPAAAQELIDATVDEFGGVDILINNAGIALAKSTTQTTDDEWERVLNVNLTGPWRCAKAAIPHMIRRGCGAIVNVASNAGLVGFPSLAAYCASKGGLVSLTRAMALDCAAHNVRVNAVCPGHTRTPMGEGFIAAQDDPDAFIEEFIRKRHPLGRMAEAEEVARTILFLASENASFVTGAILTADGGYTAR